MQEEEEDKDDTEGWRSVGPALARESDSSSPLCTRTRLSPGRSFKFQAQEDGEGEGRRNVTDEHERGRERASSEESHDGSGGTSDRRCQYCVMTQVVMAAKKILLKCHAIVEKSVCLLN